MEPWFTFGVPVGAFVLACGSYAYARLIAARFEKRYPLTEAGYPQQHENVEQHRESAASPGPRDLSSRSDQPTRMASPLAAGTSLHMRVDPETELISADGQTIGLADELSEPTDGSRTAKAGKPHHYIPLAWVDHVDQRVVLNKTAAEMAGSEWSSQAASSVDQR